MAILDKNRHLLVCLNPNETTEFITLRESFYGEVATTFPEEGDPALAVPRRIIYICGDLGRIPFYALSPLHAPMLRIIAGFTYATFDSADVILEYLHWNNKFVSIGQVPRNVHDVGVYYPQFIADTDIFRNIETDHNFQSLTESNKPGRALRMGIYLSDVTSQSISVTTTTAATELAAPDNSLPDNSLLDDSLPDDSLPDDSLPDVRYFNLLRCSTNLGGPTEGFGETDARIISLTNQMATEVFHDHAPLNHVLAQIYCNTEQGRAKISPHSDKTKDMPTEAIMAFCTFYDTKTMQMPLERSKTAAGTASTASTASVGAAVSLPNPLTIPERLLTGLRFRRKPSAPESLIDDFTVTLEPNSVFFIPLSTNRLYTHEIQPASAAWRQMPTRMGYVIRCSDTQAIHRDGQTYVRDKSGESYTPLRAITEADLQEMRALYLIENRDTDIVVYPPTYFSMNEGDYYAPVTSNEVREAASFYRAAQFLDM